MASGVARAICLGGEEMTGPANASVFRGEHIIPNPKARLLDQVREVLRLKHYSLRTEETYVGWINRFIFVLRTVQRTVHAIPAAGRCGAITEG